MKEQASTARQRELGAGLRRLRERCDVTGVELAARLGSTPSMLSRLESGKRPSAPMEVFRYAVTCGARRDEQDALVRLAGEPDDYRLESHDGTVVDLLDSAIFNESTACAIESLNLVFVPAIVQTGDYARAVFESMGSVDPAKIDGWVEARMSRRMVLSRAEPAQCVLFVHEWALRPLVGGPRVMHEQLLGLVFENSQPHCEIRVVPVSAGLAGVARNSFSHFSYADAAPLIHIESATTSEFLESDRDTEAYRNVLDRVGKNAMTVFESNDFMMRLASEYDSG